MKILVIGKYNPLDSTNPIILIKIGLLQTLPEPYWELSFQKKILKFPYSCSLDQLSPSILLIIILYTAYPEHLFPLHFSNFFSSFFLFRRTDSPSLSFHRPTSSPLLVSAPFLDEMAKTKGYFLKVRKYHSLIFSSADVKRLSRGFFAALFSCKMFLKLARVTLLIVQSSIHSVVSKW